MTEFLLRLFGSSPDLVTTIEDETLIDGVYTATWTMVGQFSGVPYSAKGISIIKFRRRSAQVYYQRDYYSENDIMINIPGLDEAVMGFRTFYRCAVDPTFDCPLQGRRERRSCPRLEPTDAMLNPDKSDDRHRSRGGSAGSGWRSGVRSSRSTPRTGSPCCRTTPTTSSTTIRSSTSTASRR